MRRGGGATRSETRRALALPRCPTALAAPAALAVIALAVIALAAPAALAQGYRARIDVRSQSVRYRGWQIDSVLATDVVTSPAGGPATPDGFAVTCVSADPYCFYFQAGPVRHPVPFSTTATATAWGLGLTGLSVHGSVRLLTDLTGDQFWPGTEPAAQLIELYADYRHKRFGARAGRMIESNRIGFAGYDGVRLTARALRRRLELTGYGGLGLARSSLLPINNPQLDPFGQFQLAERQIIAGGNVAWNDRYVDARIDYQRQVDRTTRFFVSERAAISTAIRPTDRISLRGNLVYDLAFGRLGTADATLNWNSPFVSAAAGYRHYRPTFQLWEIWGAFNTIPYNAVIGSLWLGPWKGLRFTARGEAYQYDDNSLPSPLVTIEDSGWRSRLGASYNYGEFNLGLGYSADVGPGAASSGWDALFGYHPSERWQFTLNGGRFVRPLELRFNQSTVKFVGVDATFRLPQQFQFRVRADYYDEDRDRPDAAAFSWDQTRLSAEVTFYLSSKVAASPLPPGRMPERAP